MTLPSSVTRYLARRTIPGPWQLSNVPVQAKRAAVVIPALAEGRTLDATLASLAANPASALAQTLIVVVINRSERASEVVVRSNQDDLDRLPHLGRELGLAVAWVDATSAGFALPGRLAGVGAARKLGFDLALPHLDWAAPPVLLSLDADTVVEPDYLPRVVAHFAGQGGAVTIPFAHQPADDPEHQDAIDRYELFLRCHLLGLARAGSPYAFATVGSAFACRGDSYVRSDGMNRRRGGEDFYFLQQMAKTDGVVALTGTRVRPSARASWRVPFGTGPSVARQLNGLQNGVDCYPVDCYRLLAAWLRAVESRPDATAEHLLAQAAGLSEPLARFLDQCGWAETWGRLCANHPPAQRVAAFHRWFDGLKTLRLIHALCEDRFPRQPVEQAAPALFAWCGLDQPESLAGMLDRLQQYQSGEAWRKITDNRQKLC